MALATHQLGSPSGNPRIVLAHGFTQNARCWGAFGDRLATTFDVTAVDAPGHGDSHHDDDDLVAAGERIVDCGGPAHYVGYSMGGRMLLHAALGTARDSIDSLVLIGATGGIDDDDERAQRLVADNERATTIRSIGTAAFLDRWLASPLFADLTDEQACRTERLTNRAEGMASSLEQCGTGTQEPLWSRLHQINAPVLVLAGTNDTKFTALGQRLAASIGPNARFRTCPGGHAVHLENPGAVADEIERWHADRE